MKVCSVCGDEIATKDGENRCAVCEDEVQSFVRKAKARARRRAREELLRDCGLVKVRGALGGTYWE